MTRGQLERRLWHGLQNLGADRDPRAVQVIENWLEVIDVYAATTDVAIRTAIARSDTPYNTRERRQVLEGKVS